MIMQLAKRIPALALLAGAVFLLQTHAMDYWTRYDQTTGWLWSIVIECAAIWLWAARSLSKNLLAAVATSLALAAPLYQLAAPVLEQQQQQLSSASQLPDRIASAQAEIQQLEADLATYNSNSESRGGWLAIIETTKADLKHARTELDSLRDQQAEPVTDEHTILLQLGTQGLAMILLQCLVVLTTKSVFAPVSVAGKGNPILAPEEPAGPADATASRPAFLTLVKRLATGKRLTPMAA